MNSLISIIAPVYGVEDYIERFIESVVYQDYKFFELILVNDGTKDNSVEKARNLLCSSNINYKILEKENGGVSSARNLGLKNCSGEYVVFLDSDDVICKSFLKELYAIIEENSDVDVAICNYEFVKEQRINNIINVDCIVYDSQTFFKHFLVRDISFALPTMLIKKDILIKNMVLFDEKQAFSEDQQFMWEVILTSTKIGYTKEKMYGYYLRPNSTMTSSNVNKILNGYNEYVIFCGKLVDKYNVPQNISKQILSRWIMGTLYTSSKVLSYNDFTTIYKKTFNKNIVKEVSKIKDFKATALSVMFLFSKKISYMICKDVI